MIDQLVVWVGGDPVADLAATRGGLRLEYRADTVARLGAGALCLSVALPVTPKAYQDVQTKSWCEGVLPEGETRTLLEQTFGVARGDTFGLLAALGRECAGAVAFLPVGEEPGQPVLGSQLLGADDLSAAISNLPEHPLGVDDDVRVSLGGLQAKLLLTRTPGGWVRPGPGSPSTHILKPDPTDPRLEGLVASEAMVLRASQIANVPTAAVELTSFAGRIVLVVERFDRTTVGTAVSRVHQEDGCQALGVPPGGRHKYQTVNPAAPSYAKLARVLA